MHVDCVTMYVSAGGGGSVSVHGLTASTSYTMTVLVEHDDDDDDVTLPDNSTDAGVSIVVTTHHSTARGHAIAASSVHMQTNVVVPNVP